MLAERGISVDHSTIHRGVVHFSLVDHFTRRKRSFNGRSMPARLIKVQGQWTYLSTALLNAGVTQSNSGSASIAIFLPPTPIRERLSPGMADQNIVIDARQTNHFLWCHPPHPGSGVLRFALASSANAIRITAHFAVITGFIHRR